MLSKELLNYVKEKRHLIIYNIIINLFSLFFSLLTTLFLVLAVKEYISSSFKIGTFNLLLALIFIVLKIIATLLSTKINNLLADYVTDKLRRDTYNKYISINGELPFKTSSFSELSTNGIEQLRLYYSLYIPSLFYAFISPLILFIIFSFIKFEIALVYLVCVPLIPLSIILVSKWAKKIFNKYWDLYLSLGDDFLDNVKGMNELKIFMYDDKKAQDMKNSSKEFRIITMKVLTMQLASTTIMDIVSYGGAGLGIVLSLIAHQNGLDLYSCIFMILVGSEFFLPMRALGSAFHISMNGATAGKRIMQLFNEKDKEYLDETLESIDKIELKDYFYKYDQELILKNINMEFEKGFYSIVGLSGSGKSTISKSLARILETRNTIFINDQEINKFSRESFYSQVAYISNNTYLFSMKIKDLFKFYNPNIEEKEMLNLLKKVKLEVLIEEGLDYKINPSSTNLSGGEIQRLILALYLSKKYSLYIFDEATSNIDKDSEDIIVEIIKELASQAIVIFISHRLKNVINSKYIYFIEDKKVIEEGSFTYLIEMKNKFFKLYNYQKELEEY